MIDSFEFGHVFIVISLLSFVFNYNELFWLIRLFNKFFFMSPKACGDVQRVL